MGKVPGHQLSFEGKLGIIVDRECPDRDNRRLARLLKETELEKSVPHLDGHEMAYPSSSVCLTVGEPRSKRWWSATGATLLRIRMLMSSTPSEKAIAK